MSSSSLFEIPQQVAVALTLASNATGADFDYLMKTAARESNFRPAAVARSSSARGLFQFIEGTWLRTLKVEGSKFGLHHLAEQITRTSSGRYVVRDKAARRKILKLRHDPNISALMAGAFTRSNSEFLAQKIGRLPTGGELYLAHFLGATDAVRMIKLQERNPYWRADRAFPQAARANRSIFYDRKRARGVREVYRKLVRTYRRSGKFANNSWATHIIKVDPTALKLRRSVPNFKSGHVTKRATLAAVPLPVLKIDALSRGTSPLAHIQTHVSRAALGRSSQSASVTSPLVERVVADVDPIGALLRGTLRLPKSRARSVNETVVSFNEGPFRQ